MQDKPNKPLIAIACGGTGGHVFPGLAIGEALLSRGCEVLLLISPKDIDQEAVKSARDMRVCTLPAAGFSRGQLGKAMVGLYRSFWATRQLFRERAPQGVLAMGGFTSAAPILAGKMCGAVAFLHESNTIPGKANRWFARLVDQAFIGFPSAAKKLSARNILATGTPVRPQFVPADPAAARMALGLNPEQPVLLVMGGSQGASGINGLVLQALPEIIRSAGPLQFLHLTGEKEYDQVRAAYQARAGHAVVRPFLTEMELALASATLAVSRAGASSLAELAAMQVPALLIPFPSAADNHQYFNARALADAGAAWMLEQRAITPAQFADAVVDLMKQPARLARLREEILRWHSPRAAEQIAEKMLAMIRPLGLGLPAKETLGKPEALKAEAPMPKEQPPSLAV